MMRNPNIGPVSFVNTKTSNAAAMQTDEPKIKCFKSELKQVSFMTVSELFQGFDTIKAITFSYDISFIDKILSQFKYGEIILGADFLVQKDAKLTGLMKEIFTNAYEATQLIRSHEHLVGMMKNGDVFIRTPGYIMDHRKIYLLKSDTGKTRVIISSANMSRSAWNGEHMEFYDFDDTPACYEEYENDFETAWLNSEEIPYDVVSAKKTENIVDGNPFIKKVKETDSAIVLKQPAETVIENIKYVIEHEKISEEYKKVLSDIRTKSKNGCIEVIPKTITKIEHNFKKITQKYRVNNITESYPCMTFDYGNCQAFINDKPLNLNPSDEEVRNDIEQLLSMFENFNQFVGDTERLKEMHFKLMNAIFASPFHAKLRCECTLRDVKSDLPLYLLVASKTANCGKTFMISAALKMMTGKNITPFNRVNLNKDKIEAMQAGCKGIPVFIDEADSKSMSYIKNIIRNPERCEDNQIDTMPMLIFASNDVLDPDEILRKRMAFLKLEGRLPSNIDQSAFKNQGRAILRKLGTGLYREYLRRMITLVSNELDFIMTEKEIPGNYYPDTMKMSSDVLVEIIREYGYDVPEYIRELTWYGDYSVNADYIFEDALNMIMKLWENNRKAFTLSKELVTIEMANNNENRKKCESWINTLPSELDAEMTSLRDCIRITFKREEFEKRTGNRLRKSWFLGRR